MPEKQVSVDEFLSKRSGATRGDTLLKVFKAPPSWSNDTRSARFTMSSDAPDRDKDIVHQDGLDTSTFMKNPQALLFHQSRGFPIGAWSNIGKGKAGAAKTTEGDLTFLPEGADPDADRAAKHVQFGTLRTVSIGFIPKSIRARERDPDCYYSGYDILEAELIECSLVPVPAQPDALVKSANGDMALARELVEEILDTYAKTPDGLLVPRAEYERAYKIVSSKAPKTVDMTVTVDAKDAIRDIEEAKTALEALLKAEKEAASKDVKSKGMKRLLRKLLEGASDFNRSKVEAQAAEKPSDEDIAEIKALSDEAFKRSASLIV